MLQHYINFVNAIAARKDEEKGASAVEYGLLVAAIAAVIVAIVFLLGGVIEGAFNDTYTAVNNGG